MHNMEWSNHESIYDFVNDFLQFVDFLELGSKQGFSLLLYGLFLFYYCQHLFVLGHQIVLYINQFFYSG